ncbi:hypothetical protein ACFFV7_03015 [Nonomuraea spiralis]|uniref:Uncharacterized protein n=1 Tax=Nonomuraea spiralis TaxID=46182 RepID=A0ABV5I6J6_9ACTN|nr:hypothetical protein [Nonomuraea spiralis]GGS66272.1 hypothetical protein GCM10010176_006050 [Nonomuraea spiralis]
MDDSSYFSRTEAGFTIDILLDGDSDPSLLEVGDAIITLPSGARYSALMMTYGEVGRLLSRHEKSGESLAGRYWCAPDLIVVRDAGVESMVDVIRDILESEEIAALLPRIRTDGVMIKPDM